MHEATEATAHAKQLHDVDLMSATKAWKQEEAAEEAAIKAEKEARDALYLATKAEAEQSAKSEAATETSGLSDADLPVKQAAAKDARVAATKAKELYDDAKSA